MISCLPDWYRLGLLLNAEYANSDEEPGTPFFLKKNR